MRLDRCCRFGRDVVDQAGQQLVHRGLAERIQGDELAVAPLTQGGSSLTQLGPGEADHEQRQVTYPVDEVVEEVEEALVGVVQVLDEQQHGALPGQPLEEAPPTGEQLCLRQLGPCRLGVRQAEQGSQPVGHQRLLGDVEEQVAQGSLELGLDLREVVVLGDAQSSAHHLAQRPVRRVLAERRAAPAVPEDRLRESVDVLLQLPAQP